MIKSCCKLAYEHAQGFIEQPDKDWRVEELPPISEKFSVEQIKEKTLNLHKVCCFQDRRFFSFYFYNLFPLLVASEYN